MYEKSNRNYIIAVIIMAIFILAELGIIIYVFSSSSGEIRELKKEFAKLYRSGAAAEEKAKSGLGADRKIIERTRKIKQRNIRDYKEVSKASAGLGSEVDKIIETSEFVKYVGMDGRGLKCFRIIRSTDMVGGEMKNDERK